MQHCKVVDCITNTPGKSNRSIAFYKIPRDPYFQKLWTENCGRPNVTQRDNFYVCSRHFVEDDFDVDYNNKKKLKVIAVPTKNLPGSNLNNDQNLYMSSLEAVDDLSTKTNPKVEDSDECQDGTSENPKNTGDLEKQYNHLQLEFEILEDRVKDRETHLLSLKKENSMLNELLGKMP